MFTKFAILLFTISLIGCGTSSTLVMNPVDQRVKVSGIAVNSDNHNINVPKNIETELKEKIEIGLYGEGGFTKSKELILSFKFLQHDKGNQFSRWFSGGIGNAGEASLTVQVTYHTSDGSELGKTQVQGRINSGFFGGSYSEVLSRVAEDIVSFTISNFPNKT